MPYAYNIDANGTAVVPGTSSVPNPEFWKLAYKNGKGFVLIEGGEEIVRDV